MALIRQRKLTKQQIRRIDKQQLESQDSIDDSLMDGVVMAHYGKQLEVQVTSLPAVIAEPPEIGPDDPEPFWQSFQSRVRPAWQSLFYRSRFHIYHGPSSCLP